MQENQNNKTAEPFWLLFTAIVVFGLFSFVKTDFSIGSFQAKPINILSDLQRKVSLTEKAPLSPVLNGKRMAARNVFMAPALSANNISEFGTDTSGGLINFFLALEQLKTGKKKQVRVAYFGDSMIEGDLITQDLRKALQDTFGGYGVGFMPVTSIVAGFRTSIIHSFSKNWTDYNLSTPSASGHAPGISGHTFIPVYTGAAIDSLNPESSGASWVKYTASKFERLNKFYNVRLFYGKPEGDQYVNFNGTSVKLDGPYQVNEIYLNKDNPIQSFTATFSSSAPLDVYGFSMDSETGIFVDNYSFRGNSGLPLGSFSQNIMNGLHSYLGYDLIILHYGVNVVNSKLKDYNWYTLGMSGVVEKIRKSFPGASVLIISTGDKGYRKEGKMTTDPAVPFLVDAQRKLAEKTGSAFWSLFDAMGGHESMIKWVEGDTAYANKDYTHFNHRGARRVGKMLYKEIINEYNRYKKSSES
ncbi:MAG: hypothetical protein Fur0041_14880 [Bacteroidia bacterium]